VVDERVHFGANPLVFVGAVAAFDNLSGGQTRILKFLLRDLQIMCWDLHRVNASIRIRIRFRFAARTEEENANRDPER
jgi:hypothetical protein